MLEGPEGQLGVCGCCAGLRTVLSIEGKRRPCSRCNIEGFRAWTALQRDLAAMAQAEARVQEAMRASQVDDDQAAG